MLNMPHKSCCIQVNAFTQPVSFVVPFPGSLKYSSKFNTASGVLNKNHSHIMNLQRGWVCIY